MKIHETSAEKKLEITSISFPESNKLLLKKMFIPLILYGVLFVFLSYDLVNNLWILILAFIGMAIIASLNYYHMKVFYFALGNEYLIIKKYAVRPHEIVIEFARINDIVVHRDNLDKLFGLYQVIFKSDQISPKARKMAYLEGLDEVEAHELKLVIDHKLAKTAQKSTRNQ